MVNKKMFKKAGKAIGDATSIFKKYARKSVKLGLKGLQKTVEVAGDSLKKIKNKAKKLTKAQVTVLVSLGAVGTYAGVNVGDAITEYNKRNNKEFIVKEVFYKEGDTVDEISFVILNPDKIEIYPEDTFVIIESESSYMNEIKNKTIILNELAYVITETKISKDKENDDQPDLNPDVPYVVTIKINGLDLAGNNKNMLKSGEKIFVLKLKPDINNDIKDEFEDDIEVIVKTVEDAVKDVADTNENILQWILNQLMVLLKPILTYGGIGIAIVLVLYLLYLLLKFLFNKYILK